MKDEDWLRCTWPGEMIPYLPTERNDWRIRLFGCACCRRIWGLLIDDRSRKVIELAERHAAGQAGDRELAAGCLDAYRAHQALSLGEQRQLTASSRAHALNMASRAAACMGERTVSTAFKAADLAAAAVGHAAAAARWGEDGGIEWAAHDHFDQEAYDLELAGQCLLLRDLFGSPLRPGEDELPWRTPTVATLARATDQERLLPGGELDKVRLAVLADALEEAGCSDPAILEHLRGPGPHVPGCWAVEFLLARRGWGTA